MLERHFLSTAEKRIFWAHGSEDLVALNDLALVSWYEVCLLVSDAVVVEEVSEFTHVLQRLTHERLVSCFASLTCKLTINEFMQNALVDVVHVLAADRGKLLKRLFRCEPDIRVPMSSLVGTKAHCKHKDRVSPLYRTFLTKTRRTVGYNFTIFFIFHDAAHATTRAGLLLPASICVLDVK